MARTREWMVRVRCPYRTDGPEPEGFKAAAVGEIVELMRYALGWKLNTSPHKNAAEIVFDIPRPAHISKQQSEAWAEANARRIKSFLWEAEPVESR